MDTSSTLLRRVRDRGDAASWRRFVGVYEPLVVRYALSRGLGEPDARDVAQDVFARLPRALPGFDLDRGRGRFRTWLYQVTASALADRHRPRRTREAAERGWHDRRAAAADRAEWDRAFRRRVLDHALDAVRAATNPRTWACFEGHVLGRRPAAEVAAGLGLSANAVYVNASHVLARVRAACAECLGELSDDPDDLPG
jgi:RNA polymerase sigma-70 factor (ECF subfamily)